MSHSLEGRNRLIERCRIAVPAAIALALVGCGGDDNCSDCGFAPAPATEVSLGVVAGNFTGNGHTTVVALSTIQYASAVNSGNLKIYPSTGAGTFGPPMLVAAGNDPLYVASADLNGDHRLDIVTASVSDGTLSIFFNNAQTPGTFGTPLILMSPGASQVAIADMNGDGLPDLVSADYNVTLFPQTSPGVFGNPIPLHQGGANWVAVGDLNGDGIPDVALTDAGGVQLLMHQGPASSLTFAAPVQIFTQTPNVHVFGWNLIAIADMDGDGLNDLVITDPGPSDGSAPTVSILFQDKAHPGQFLDPIPFATAKYSLAMSIVVTDVNGDGHPDIVIGGTEAVTVLLQSSTSPGTFTSASYQAPNANEIAVADANGDGLPDIIVSSNGNQPLVNGVATNAPGVLLQVPGSKGTFSALQSLP